MRGLTVFLALVVLGACHGASSAIRPIDSYSVDAIVKCTPLGPDLGVCSVVGYVNVFNRGTKPISVGGCSVGTSKQMYGPKGSGSADIQPGQTQAVRVVFVVQLPKGEGANFRREAKDWTAHCMATEREA